MSLFEQKGDEKHCFTSISLAKHLICSKRIVYQQRPHVINFLKLNNNFILNLFLTPGALVQYYRPINLLKNKHMPASPVGIEIHSCKKPVFCSFDVWTFLSFVLCFIVRSSFFMFRTHATRHFRHDKFLDRPRNP
jgi:hypothetical protein